MTSTFERYVDQLEIAALIGDGVVSRDDLVTMIRLIDSAVAAIEGRGFRPTPFGPQDELANALGLATGTELWVKDETANVSGSHKTRHLFGVALANAVQPPAVDGPFAIASCGNAALAAAVIAQAVDHALNVFVPRWANEAVVARIESLGGNVIGCDRGKGVLGDPAHKAMVAAIHGGDIAFSCQGTETPTTIDGGRTIAYEMVDSLAAARPDDVRLDRLFIQVGGGALGSAIVSGLDRADLLTTGPVVHAVQPVGNHPLVRAWDRLIADLLARDWGTLDNADRVARSVELGRLDGAGIDAALDRCQADSGRFMAVWDDEPVSYATGILDDITYDWLPLIRAMLESRGCPLVASEPSLKTAHRLAHTHTTIPVCPTGSAGLGGLLDLLTTSPATMAARERIAVVFSGSMRPGDPDPLGSPGHR